VVEYLESLTWDGTHRIGSWLVDYLGADDEPITRTMSSKFLIAACARAYNPGCQVDTALILKGPQGNGKTSILRILGGEWYVCLSEKLGDKDSRMKAASGWIVEIAELAGMTAADSRAIKSFLDQTDDIFRPPYGASMLTFKRHCVFTGTTNEDDYLLDQTGARRFWVTESDKPVALDKAITDRDQLWAEARDAYKAGAIWWATPEELPLFEARASTAQEDSPTAHVEDAVEKWWARLNKSHRTRDLGWEAFEIVENVLGVERRDITKHHRNLISKSLKKLGWRRDQKGKDRKLYWNPPFEWHGRETAKIGVVK
jgi:predicted P-loop ATPase